MTAAPREVGGCTPVLGPPAGLSLHADELVANVDRLAGWS